MNANEKDITRRVPVRLCEAKDCTSKPDGRAARFCARHRKQRQREAQARLKSANAAQIRVIQSEAEEPKPAQPPEQYAPQAETDGVYRLPDARRIGQDEICPNRASYIDEFIAKIQGNRR